MIAPPRPPTHDELEALIKEARARQLRRRLLGAAGVAIVAALGLSVHSFVGAGSVSNAGQPPASAGSLTGPRCRASQLSATIGFGGATGSLLGGATVKNTSDSTCTLPRGRPRVRISLHGRPLSVREVVPPNQPPGATAHVLRPGHKAIVWLQWFNWCGRSSVPSVFALQFHGGPTVQAAEDGLPRCDDPQVESSIYVSVPRLPQ